MGRSIASPLWRILIIGRAVKDSSWIWSTDVSRARSLD